MIGLGELCAALLLVLQPYTTSAQQSTVSRARSPPSKSSLLSGASTSPDQNLCVRADPQPKTKPKRKNNVGMEIVLMNVNTDDKTWVNHWSFFHKPVGNKSNPCEYYPFKFEPTPTFLSEEAKIWPPWPRGTWKLELYGEPCTYKSNGNGPTQGAGRLFCPSYGGEKNPISCSTYKRWHKPWVGEFCKYFWKDDKGKIRGQADDAKTVAMQVYRVAWCDWYREDKFTKWLPKKLNWWTNVPR